MGAKHVLTELDEVHVDDEHNIVTAAAYMCDTPWPHEVFDNVSMMVDEVLKRC